MSRDPVETEWRRIRARLRRHGPLQTTEYVLRLGRNGNYPLWYLYKLGEYLLKHGEMVAAEKLLRGVRRSREPHVLTHQLYGDWLWCVGKRRAAIRFLSKQSKLVPHSILYNSLAAMYRLSGNKRMDEKCLRMAVSLARKELAEPPHPVKLPG